MKVNSLDNLTPLIFDNFQKKDKKEIKMFSLDLYNCLYIWDTYRHEYIKIIEELFQLLEIILKYLNYLI